MARGIFYKEFPVFDKIFIYNPQNFDLHCKPYEI